MAIVPVVKAYGFRRCAIFVLFLVDVSMTPSREHQWGASTLGGAAASWIDPKREANENENPLIVCSLDAGQYNSTCSTTVHMYQVVRYCTGLCGAIQGHCNRQPSAHCEICELSTLTPVLSLGRVHAPFMIQGTLSFGPGSYQLYIPIIDDVQLYKNMVYTQCMQKIIVKLQKLWKSLLLAFYIIIIILRTISQP
jgi:hypothetical protein